MQYNASFFPAPAGWLDLPIELRMHLAEIAEQGESLKLPEDQLQAEAIASEWHDAIWQFFCQETDGPAGASLRYSCTDALAEEIAQHLSDDNLALFERVVAKF